MQDDTENGTKKLGKKKKKRKTFGKKKKKSYLCSRFYAHTPK